MTEPVKITKIFATLRFRNPTKRTYRFEEEPDSPGYLQTLYVQQRAFTTQPKRVKVTVEVLE